MSFYDDEAFRYLCGYDKYTHKVLFGKYDLIVEDKVDIIGNLLKEDYDKLKREQTHCIYKSDIVTDSLDCKPYSIIKVSLTDNMQSSPIYYGTEMECIERYKSLTENNASINSYLNADGVLRAWLENKDVEQMCTASNSDTIYWIPIPKYSELFDGYVYRLKPLVDEQKSSVSYQVIKNAFMEWSKNNRDSSSDIFSSHPYDIFKAGFLACENYLSN